MEDGDVTTVNDMEAVSGTKAEAEEDVEAAAVNGRLPLHWTTVIPPSSR